MISKVKEGYDLGRLSMKELELKLKSELYIDINSPFAKEIQAEIELRLYKNQKKRKK